MLDMTLSAISNKNGGESNSMKRLNNFEREYGKIMNIDLDLLQREDLTMESMAKLKLLKRF